MAQRTDLYSILLAYSNKNNSPYIEIESFLDFLGKYAKKVSVDQPEWNKWVQDRSVKFWSEISALTEEGKCELLTDTPEGRVYMSHFYLELIKKAYGNADEDADIPFPSEESLRITLPETQIKSVSSEYDLSAYLAEPQETDIPVLKITFPEGISPALTLAGMIPRRLAEMAILKIRHYLRKYGNQEYAIKKLSPQLQGKETYLRDQFHRVLLRPLDCYNAIEEGGEFSYLFWAHFCILVKNDIKKKKERLPEDIAAIQSVFIIEVINEYYKTLAVKRRELELAFKSLENHLSQPPYLYTLGQILKFTSQKGVLLLGQYSKENLEAWLRKKTTESEDNKLPVLLIVRGYGSEKAFLLKEKTLALCVRLLAEARVQVKDAVSKHWCKILSDYRSEPAMENDGEFEKALVKYTARLCPVLRSLLEDTKLLLVYEEMEQRDEGVPAAARIFNNGQLLPYSALLLVKRKELLTDAKLILPFWYSLPFITAIIAFFKNFSRGKKNKKQTLSEEEAGQEIPEEQDRYGEIRTAAEDLEYTLVPAGYSLEEYLEELETRWSRLIDRTARENLIEDVKTLVRDHLRQNLKLIKKHKLAKESVNQMALNIVTRTPSLAVLGSRDSLCLYIELYLIQLLENIR